MQLRFRGGTAMAPQSLSFWRAMGEDRSLYICRLILFFCKCSRANGMDGASFHWSHEKSNQNISYEIHVELVVNLCLD